MRYLCNTCMEDVVLPPQRYKNDSLISSTKGRRGSTALVRRGSDSDSNSNTDVLANRNRRQAEEQSTTQMNNELANTSLGWNLELESEACNRNHRETELRDASQANMMAILNRHREDNQARSDAAAECAQQQHHANLKETGKTRTQAMKQVLERRDAERKAKARADQLLAKNEEDRRQLKLADEA